MLFLIWRRIRTCRKPCGAEPLLVRVAAAEEVGFLEEIVALRVQPDGGSPSLATSALIDLRLRRLGQMLLAPPGSSCCQSGSSGRYQSSSAAVSSGVRCSLERTRIPAIRAGMPVPWSGAGGGFVLSEIRSRPMLC